ncbi:MAG: maleylacetoacetate isomerase [Polyangiales bacterium]|nr:maleylacetoacetate isomerase [Myxococcales bacterium]MCB9660164.1 maleylacetoacetate isomerase [Sandaracinaceae bacterium]
MRLYAFYRSSASYRVRLALAHKQLPYTVVPVALGTGAQREAEHRARNPMGQVPVLELGADQGHAQLAQSVAIMEYLEEVHPEPALLPSTPLERARVRELVELVNSGIQPLQNLSVLQHVTSLGADFGDWARHFVGRGLVALEERSRATRGAFLFGDTPTLADVCLVPQMYNARVLGVSLDALGALVDIDARAQALAGWAAAHPDAQPDSPPS